MPGSGAQNRAGTVFTAFRLKPDADAKQSIKGDIK
jgi:hypothetical protein